MWDVQDVRRHRMVPSLELPHHRGIAAVPLLQEDRRLDRYDNLPVGLAKGLESIVGFVQWELVDSRGFQLSIG